jgi:hypothetical protein
MGMLAYFFALPSLPAGQFHGEKNILKIREVRKDEAVCCLIVTGTSHMKTNRAEEVGYVALTYVSDKKNNTYNFFLLLFLIRIRFRRGIFVCSCELVWTFNIFCLIFRWG